MKRHPLAEALAKAYRDTSMNAKQLRASIDRAQVELEACWDRGEFARYPGLQPNACAREGCNYRRYPLANARFCLFHSSGHSSLAARLRQLEAQP
jgi:hypothetical protein